MSRDGGRQVESDGSETAHMGPLDSPPARDVYPPMVGSCQDDQQSSTNGHQKDSEKAR